MLDKLPDEILYLVLKNFDNADILENVALCSHKLRRVCLDGRLWAKLYLPIQREIEQTQFVNIQLGYDYHTQYLRQRAIDGRLTRLLQTVNGSAGNKIDTAIEVSRYEIRAIRALNNAINDKQEEFDYLSQIKNGIIHLQGFQEMLSIRQSKTEDVVGLMLALDRFWFQTDRPVIESLNQVIENLLGESTPPATTLREKAWLISKKLLEQGLLSWEYTDKWHCSFLSSDIEDASCLALACRYCYVMRHVFGQINSTPVLLFKSFVKIDCGDSNEIYYVDVTRGGKIRTAQDIFQLYRALNIRPFPSASNLNGLTLNRFANYALSTTKMWLKRYPTNKRATALIGLVMIRNIFLTMWSTKEQLEVQLFRALDLIPSGLKYEVAILQNGIHQTLND